MSGASNIQVESHRVHCRFGAALWLWYSDDASGCHADGLDCSARRVVDCLVGGHDERGVCQCIASRNNLADDHATRHRSAALVAQLRSPMAIVDGMDRKLSHYSAVGSGSLPCILPPGNFHCLVGRGALRLVGQLASLLMSVGTMVTGYRRSVTSSPNSSNCPGSCRSTRTHCRVAAAESKGGCRKTLQRADAGRSAN